MATTLEVVTSLYQNLLGRTPAESETGYWVQRIDSGVQTVAQVVVDFTRSTEALTDVAPISDLYFALLGRAPDAAGLAYWLEAKRTDLSLKDIAASLVQSQEFIAAQGATISDATFLSTLYLNALDRAPDAAGLAYWSNELANGVSREEVLIALLSAPESVQTTGAKTQVALTYQGLLGRAPTDQELNAVLQGKGNATLAELIAKTADTLLAGNSPVTPPVTTPGTPDVPDVPDLPVYPQTALYTPKAGTTTGSSDASTAIALDSKYMVVGDDEASVLRVYDRAGGDAVLEWDYSQALGTSDEVDLEAGTLIGNTLYLIGSHSNKKDGSEADSREVIFSVNISGTGASTEFEYNGKFTGFETALVAWDAGNVHGLGANYFGLAASSGAGLSPERVNGFSIEGLTSSPTNDALWLAFRAPQTDTTSRDKALIVPVENFAALIGGSATEPTFGEPIELNLGGRGIRSIDKATDGSGYLIIAGPSGTASDALDNNFRLFTWDGKADSQPVELSNDLDALLAITGGSFESLVSPASILAGTEIQLLQDNGDTVWTGQTDVSKDLDPAEQQFQGNAIILGTAVTDKAAPLLVSSTPADNAAGVAADSAFVLTFNEGVALGDGVIELRDAQNNVLDSEVTVNFNVVTVRPLEALSFSSEYHLVLTAGAITDHYGNATTVPKTLEVKTSEAPTPLAAGDLLFVAGNAEAPDAIAFILLKDITGGTSVNFTDRDYNATTDFTGITNESAFTWTAGQDLKAGTVITIQTDTSGNPIANIGTTLGSSGGIGKSETYYAMQGATIANLQSGSAGEITNTGTLLASLTLGGTAGAIPDALTTAGTAFSFTISPANQTNARYTGSLDATDLVALAASIKDLSNWEANYTKAPGFTLVDNSLFGAPLLSSGEVKGAQITLTWNQALDIDNLPAGSAFSVLVNDKAVVVDTVSGAGDTLNLTLASPVVGGATVTLGYADPSSANDIKAIQLVNGSDAASFTLYPLTNTSPDSTAPTLLSSTPADDASSVTPFADVVLTFDESVQKGSGSILFTSTDGAASITVDVTSNQVTISGSTVTINPTAFLEQGHAYTVSIASGVFTDTTGNAFAGNGDSLSFSTGTTPTHNLLISEVNSNGTGEDFFELYNYGSTAIDLSGWRMNDSAATFSKGITFPEGLTLAAGTTLIVSAATTDTELATFKTVWGLGSDANVIAMSSMPGLGKGDAVVIFDNQGYVAAEFNYGAGSLTASDGSTLTTALASSGTTFVGGAHAGKAYGAGEKVSAIWDGLSETSPAYLAAVNGEKNAHAQTGDSTTVGSPGVAEVLLVGSNPDLVI